MTHHIIPQNLSITAMRSSGYRDTPHAIAELIDNSVQAGLLKTGHRTAVEVVCIDRAELVNQRTRNRIDQIAVLDDATGMDAATLRIALQFGNGLHLDNSSQTGIGKFGMGLPNASISQCKRVEVWTWQNGMTWRSYLDVDEIVSGELTEVPEPTIDSIPATLLGLFKNKPGSSGTLVVWSKIDRVNWKQSASLLRNAEFLLGRMYRHFINDNQVAIRLAAYEINGGQPFATFDAPVRPNDPLGLMVGTCAPDPFDLEPAFDQLGDPEIVTVPLGSTIAKIEIRYSICKPKVRELGGKSFIGSHVRKNQGVSVVRSRRELEMNHSFEKGTDTRERWWGIEVSFGPELDEIFGVTNSKQAATAFYYMDLEADAEVEGLSANDYRQILKDNNDPRLVIYEVSQRIRKTLVLMQSQIYRMKESSGLSKNGAPGTSSAEGRATKATDTRKIELNKPGRSDAGESAPDDTRVKGLAEEFEGRGAEPQVAVQLAAEYIRTKTKYVFQTADVPGAVIFDVSHKVGEILITLNRRHPAHEHLFEVLGSTSPENVDSPALVGLKLLLTAWARMEDEANDRRLEVLEDVRQEWGRIARDFLNTEG